MDALARHDLEVHQRTSPAQRLAEALDLMRSGIRLQRAKLEQQYPDYPEEELEKLLISWLQADD